MTSVLKCAEVSTMSETQKEMQIVDLWLIHDKCFSLETYQSD